MSLKSTSTSSVANASHVSTNTNNNENKLADAKLQQTKLQVLQLTELMQHNVEKTMQRGINLENLGYNIQNLESSASQFKTIGGKAKKKYWYKNKKWTVILAISIITLIVLLVLAIALGVGLSTNSIKLNNNSNNDG
jgi:hypothetical protein